MRKIIVIVLIGLISAAIVACGGDSAEPTNTAPPATVAQAPTEAPDTPTPAPTATTAPTNTPVPPGANQYSGPPGADQHARSDCYAVAYGHTCTHRGTGADSHACAYRSTHAGAYA